MFEQKKIDEYRAMIDGAYFASRTFGRICSAASRCGQTVPEIDMRTYHSGCALGFTAKQVGQSRQAIEAHAEEQHRP